MGTNNLLNNTTVTWADIAGVVISLLALFVSIPAFFNSKKSAKSAETSAEAAKRSADEAKRANRISFVNTISGHFSKIDIYLSHLQEGREISGHEIKDTLTAIDSLLCIIATDNDKLKYALENLKQFAHREFSGSSLYRGEARTYDKKDNFEMKLTFSEPDNICEIINVITQAKRKYLPL